MSNPSYTQAPAAARVVLHLLGSPSLVDAEGKAIVGLGPGKPLAMLAYLSVRGEARRDELIDLLWGETDESKARNAFRQALHRLRTALGEEIIPQDRERVGLGRSDLVWVDRDAFIAALDADRVEEGVAIARGDFLEGFELGEPAFDRWADSERTRLRGRLQWALSESASRALAGGRSTQALQYAQRFTGSAPYDEDAALLEATVLVSAGRLAEASRSLHRFASRLADELDLPTPPRVREMLTRLERPVERSTPPRPGDRPSGKAASDIPFVGREEELARLIAFARELSEEQGATVLVEGESGIGKTRLVEEFISRARATTRLLILRARERLGGSAVPYAGVAEALRAAARAPGVAGASQHLLAEAARILPELRDSFTLPAAGPIEDEAARLRFFEGVAAFVDAVAYEQPVCVVIDDLQHASSSTTDLLAYLSARLQHSPVLMVLSGHSGSVMTSVAGRLDALANGGRGAHIDLQPLSRDETLRLMRASAERVGTPSRDVETLLDGAAGNPFRAIELTRRIADGTAATRAPQRLRDVLWPRLQACSPSQRRVFFAAALLDRVASLRLLAAAAHLPEAATFDSAAALEHADLLVQIDDGYTLAHDVTASFVVELAGNAGRALLAGWAADALASEGGATNAELAELYAVAGRQPLAFSNARLAAYAAIGVAAMPEALRLLGIARTFAPDEKARTEIEELAEMLRGGPRRLIGAVAPVPEEVPLVPAAEMAPTQPNAAATPVDVTEPAPASSRRVAIRPRVWVVAAVGVLLAAVIGTWTASVRRAPPVPTDSVLVVEQGHERDAAVPVIIGAARGAVAVGSPALRRRGPTWMDSVSVPWTNPNPSPDGRYVTLERMTRSGTDLYAVSANRRDTIPLAVGGGDDAALGWSPDGNSVLASRAHTLPDGRYDSDLYVYRLSAPATPVPIDTSATRAVVEAVWSPDGSQIAWVARVGDARQQDVFVSRADGSNTRNVTNNAAEDNHITWSPDGTLIGFTSNRDGNSELYAYDLGDAHLWRLTNSPDQDDHAHFSPDGRSVAFESTRGGEAAVYVMPALGGEARRVTPGGRQFSLVDWRGPRTPYIDKVRVFGGLVVGVGDTLSLGVLGIDQSGLPITLHNVAWRLLDGAAARMIAIGDDSTRMARRLVGERTGFASVVASLPGWRADTLVVRVGSASYALIDDQFEKGIEPSRWISLGDPLPRVQMAPDGVRRMLALDGDLEWQSGVLSREPFAVREGVAIEAEMFARFTSPAIQASAIELSLVAPTPTDSIDRSAPQFVRYASAAWNGEAGRIVYSVERESFSEPAAALGPKQPHTIRLRVMTGGTVAFYVDDSLRWRSHLGIRSSAGLTRAQLWLGGRATGNWGGFGHVRVGISSP